MQCSVSLHTCSSLSLSFEFSYSNDELSRGMSTTLDHISCLVQILEAENFSSNFASEDSSTQAEIFSEVSLTAETFTLIRIAGFRLQFWIQQRNSVISGIVCKLYHVLRNIQKY